MKTFKDLKFEDLGILRGIGSKEYFDNGYGVSVIKGPHTYGGIDGLYEVGILFDGKLTYTTSIADDVIGNLTEEEVTEVMKQTQNLI